MGSWERTAVCWVHHHRKRPGSKEEENPRQTSQGKEQPVSEANFSIVAVTRFIWAGYLISSTFCHHIVLLLSGCVGKWPKMMEGAFLYKVEWPNIFHSRHILENFQNILHHSVIRHETVVYFLAILELFTHIFVPTVSHKVQPCYTLILILFKLFLTKEGHQYLFWRKGASWGRNFEQEEKGSAKYFAWNAVFDIVLSPLLHAFMGFWITYPEPKRGRKEEISGRETSWEEEFCVENG